jgi:hypothetical protein
MRSSTIVTQAADPLIAEATPGRPRPRMSPTTSDPVPMNHMPGIRMKSGRSAGRNTSP